MRRARPNPACPPTVKGSRDWPDGVSVGKVMSLGVVNDTVEHNTLTEEARQKLAKHGFVLGKRLGMGKFADVYGFEGEPGYILKLTGDYTEALAWTTVLSSSRLAALPNLAHTDCVFEVAGNYKTLFCIVQEKLAPLSDKMRRFFRGSSRLVETYAVGNALGTPDLLEAALRQFGYPTDGKTEAQLCKMAGEMFVDRGEEDSGLSRRKLRTFLETLKTLAQHGVSTSDLHGDNIMYDAANDLVKVTDLGLARVKGGHLPRLVPNRGKAHGFA